MSKALDKSRNAPINMYYHQKIRECHKQVSVFTVECCVLKPYCFGLIILYFIISIYKRLCITFCNIFEVLGSSEMGL